MDNNEPKIYKAKLTDFTPDPHNANKGTERGGFMIDKSVSTVGAARSLVSDSGNMIPAGNKSLQAFIDAGIEDCIVIESDGKQAIIVKRTDWDLMDGDPDNPARKYAYLDNRASELGLDWDPEVLFADMTAGFPLDEFWQDFELEELFTGIEGYDGGVEPEDAEPQISRADELQKQWGVELGQMWRLPSRVEGQEHRIICGDCTDRGVVERVMGGEKAELAWFDPPFGIDLVPQRQKTKAIENDGNNEARKLWGDFLPLLKKYMNPDTHLFLCQGWTEFDWTLPLIKKQFTLKSKIVWNKNVWGIGYYTRPKHEDIIYCWNGKPETIETPVADVWDIKRENKPEHAAEKPPELSGIAIEHFSNDGDIICDWFSGLGGSTIAAENLSRQCRACEISPNYVSVALQRYFDAFGIRGELVA